MSPLWSVTDKLVAIVRGPLIVAACNEENVLVKYLSSLERRNLLGYQKHNIELNPEKISVINCDTELFQFF